MSRMPALPMPLTSVTHDHGATAVHTGATWGGQKAQHREQRTHVVFQAAGCRQEAGTGVPCDLCFENHKLNAILFRGQTAGLLRTGSVLQSFDSSVG